MKRKFTKNGNGKKNSLLPKIPREISNNAIIRPIIVDDLLTSYTGQAAPIFQSTTNSVWSFYRFGTSADYTNISAGYQRAQLLEFRVEINRIIGENSIASAYVGGLPTLHLVYYPTMIDTAHTAANLVLVETALIVQSHNVNSVKRNYKVPSVQTREQTGGQYYLINPALPFDTGLSGHLTGQLEINWNGTGNAAATLPLYSIRIIGLMRFDYPY
jgi:hypothetical protein